MTLQRLISSTRRFKPKLFLNSNSVHIIKVKVKRYIAQRVIYFQATSMDSTTQNPRSLDMAFEVPDGAKVSSYIPRIHSDTVRVRSDSDFYKYAFGYNNASRDAHYDGVDKFKVKGTGHPINPHNSCGLDKHLLALVRDLSDSKLIRP